MIYLIRHGRTDANDRHLYCGSTDLPLSESGRAELEQLLGEIQNKMLLNAADCRFIISGMLRTRETLALLFGDVSFEIISDLREIDFGAFEMHSYEELKDDPDYQKWITGDNEKNCTPGGESGEGMTARVLPAFNRIVAEASEASEAGNSANRVYHNTVIITHGGVIATIMDHIFPDDAKNRYQWQPAPGHGYAVSFDEDNKAIKYCSAY